MKRSIWLTGLAVPPLLLLYLSLPELRVQWAKPADRENLRRLGAAVASYMADHDGAYPLVTTADFVTNTRGNPRGFATEWHNALAPYTKCADDLLSPATHAPYKLRFVVDLQYYNPRDPMAPVIVRRRLQPEPERVIAVSDAYTWSRGWIGSRHRDLENHRISGEQLVLRSDGHVEAVDLSRARMTTFDGKSGKWGAIEPAVARFRLSAWANSPWILYPREPSP